MNNLLLISQKGSRFVCKDMDAYDSAVLKQVELLIFNSMTSLLHTMADSMSHDTKYTAIGFPISSNDSFTETMKHAILFRINLVEKREEFLQFLFKEIKQSATFMSFDSNYWKIKWENEMLVLYSLIEFKAPPEPSNRVRAKVIKLSS